MIENSNSVPTKQASVYLVIIADSTDGASYDRIVRASSGYLAGAYALLYDATGNLQDVGPYQVVAVFCRDRLRHIVDEMTLFPPDDIGDVDVSAINDEISEYASISP